MRAPRVVIATLALDLGLTPPEQVSLVAHVLD
jgi:hypothetical protein